MNNLKMFVSKIADRGRADSSGGSKEEDDRVVVTNSAEGFICPVCHLDLASMEMLQDHFTSEHADQKSPPEPDLPNPEVEELKATVRILQENLDAERSHSNSLKEAMQDVKEAFLARDGKDTDILADYKLEIADLREKHESVTSKVSALTVELSHTRAELDSKDRMSRELQETIDEKDRFIAGLEKKVTELDFEVRAKSGEISRLRETVDGSKKSEADTSDRIISLTQTIAEARSVAEAKSAALNELTAERDDYRVQLKDANEKLSALRMKITNFSDENSKLHAQLESQNQALLVLRKQMASTDFGSLGDGSSLAGEDDLRAKFAEVAEMDRGDEYPSFFCHFQALEQTSMDMIRSCRQLDEETQEPGDGEEASAFEKINRLKLRLGDPLEGDDLNSAITQILLSDALPDNPSFLREFHELDEFFETTALKNVEWEGARKKQFQMSVAATVLCLLSQIGRDLRESVPDALFPNALERKKKLERYSGEVRKMSFAVVDNATAALKSLLEASNTKIDGEIQNCFKSNVEVQNLRKEVTRLSAEAAETTKALESAREELKVKEGECKRLSAEISTLKDSFDAERKELAAGKEEIAKEVIELKTELEESKRQRTSLDAENSELRGRLTEAQLGAEAAVEEERRKIAALESRQKEMLAAFTQCLRGSVSTLEAAMEDQNARVRERLSSLDDQMATLDSTFTIAKTSRESLIEAFRAERTRTEAVKLDLAEEREAQSEMKRMFIEEKMTLQSELQQKSQEVERLEGVMNELQTEHETRVEDLNTLVDSVKKKLEAEHAELEDTKSQLMETNQLLKTVQTSCSEITEEKSREIEALRAKLDDASGKRLELEALISSENEEKRAVLDRFAAMENEVTSLRSSNADLHRKLNDVEAGLHELGRENQSLQMELAKTQNRKWMDDTGVENCQGCQKEFTLTNRKHHCRHCGRIYCHECSSKTATLPSFKKPVRVCDKCCNELRQ